jgi:hypothetical protein
MAKNFDRQLKEVRKELKEFIQEQVSLGEELQYKIAITFRDRARERLIKGNNAIPSQQAFISKLANYIYVRKQAGGYAVVVQMDKEGLLMFLEYGTGLAGKNNPHPEAGEIGWVYAINERNENIYKETERGKGWFWRPQGDKNRYIDENDYVYEYQRSFAKEGTKPTDYRVDPPRGGGLWQTDRNVGDARVVFSQGIKPIRYFYLTKLEIEREIFYADGDIVMLNDSLDKLRQGSVL